MNRKRVAYAVVGLLAVLAVGLSATALTDGPVERGGGEPGTGDDPTGPAISLDPPVVDFVSPLEVLLVLLWVMIVVAVLGVVRYPLDSLKALLRTALAVAVVLGLLWVLLLGTSRFLGGGQGASPTNNSTGGGFGGGEAGGIGSGAADAVEAVTPETALLGLLLVAVLTVGLVAAVVRDRAFAAEGGDAEEPPPLAAVGRSAGAAADRLAADADVDNEVYRAWKEMTTSLDLENPAARTPAEFRDAAVDAGMAAEDVDALTELFEEVRYGGAPPTERREDRARETLRRVERRYAEGSP